MVVALLCKSTTPSQQPMFMINRGVKANVQAGMGIRNVVRGAKRRAGEASARS